MNPLPLSSHSTQPTTANSKAMADNDDDDDFDFTRGSRLMENDLGLRSLTRIREEARPRKMIEAATPPSVSPTLSPAPPGTTPTKEKREKPSKKSKKSKKGKSEKGGKSAKKSKRSKPSRDATPARMSGSSSNEMGWAGRSHPNFPVADVFQVGADSPPLQTQPQQDGPKIITNPLTTAHNTTTTPTSNYIKSKTSPPVPSLPTLLAKNPFLVQQQQHQQQSSILPITGTLVHVQNMESPSVLPATSPTSQQASRRLSATDMSGGDEGGAAGSSSTLGSDPITPLESNMNIDRRHAEIISRISGARLREDSASSGAGHGSTSFSNCDVPTDIRMFGVLPIGVRSPDDDDSPITSARRFAQHAAELERRDRRRSSESSASRGMGGGGGMPPGRGGATSGTDEDDDSSELSEPTTANTQNTHNTKSNASTHQSLWLVNKHLTNLEENEPNRRQSSVSFYDMLLHVRSSVDGLFRIHEDLTATTRCAIPITSFKIAVYEDHYRLRKFHWNGPLYIWFHAGALLYIMTMGLFILLSKEADAPNSDHSRTPTFIAFFAAFLSRLVTLLAFVGIRVTGWRSEVQSTVTALSIVVPITNGLLVVFSVVSHHFVGLAEPWDVMLLIIFTSIYGPWRGVGGTLQVAFCYILCIVGSIIMGIPLQRNSVVYVLLCVIGYPLAFYLQDMASRKLYRAVMAADATTGVIEQQKALELHIIEAFAPITIRKVFGLEKLSVGKKKGSTEDKAVCPYELSSKGTKLVALHFAKQSLGIRTTPLPSSTDLRGLPPAVSSKESQGLYAVHHGAVVLCLQFDSIHKAARERAMDVWRQRQRELLIRQINLADARLRAPVRNSENDSGDLGASVNTDRFHAAAHRNNLHNNAILNGSGDKDISFGPGKSGGPDSSGTGASITHDSTHYVDTLTNTFWIETVNRLMGYVDESLVFAVQTWHYGVAQSKEELLLPTSAILERSPLTVTSVVGNTVMLAGPFNPPIRRPDILPPPSTSNLPKPRHPRTRSERSGFESDLDEDLPKSFHTVGPHSLIGGYSDTVSHNLSYGGGDISSGGGGGAIDWSVIRKYYWSYDPPIEVTKAADMLYAQLYESDRVKFLTELLLLEKGEVEWTTLGEMFKERGVGIKAATSSNDSSSSDSSPKSPQQNNSSSGDTPNMGPSFSGVGDAANLGGALPQPVAEITFKPKPIVTTMDGATPGVSGLAFGNTVASSTSAASSKVLYHSVPSYSAFSGQLPSAPRPQDQHLPIPNPNTPMSQTAALVALLFLSHLNRKMNKGRRKPRHINTNKSSSGSVGGAGSAAGALKKGLPVETASSAEVTAALTSSTIFSSMSSTSQAEVVDSCNVFGDALLVARHLIAAAPVSCMVASSNVASVARWTLRQVATISSDATRSSLGLLTSEHVPGDDSQSREAKRRLKHAVSRLGKLEKQLSLGNDDQKWKIRGRIVRVRTIDFKSSSRRNRGGGGSGAASSSTVFSSKLVPSYTTSTTNTTTNMVAQQVSNLRQHYHPPSTAPALSSHQVPTTPTSTGAPMVPSPISQPLSSTTGGQEDEADTG